MTLGVDCEVIFSTPATRTISFSPAATLETAWKKAEPAGGAGSFESGAWYACESQASRDVGSQVILADKRRSGEVAEVKSLDL